MMPASSFRLKVQRIDQICLFELLWGQGQQLSATLQYPTLLTQLYQDWQRIYLSFYKTTPPENLRGWSIAEGTAMPSTIDWHTKLVEAETKLLNEFHRWLRSAELFEIRAAIARSSRALITRDREPYHPDLRVSLTCIPIELARFPWEAWEIGTDFAATGTIRVVRTSADIPEPPPRQRQRKARILAVLGDESGLDFQADREAVKSLSRIAEVQFVGWQPGQTASDVKDSISRAIADEQGWDVLFFAGHSNEAEITGGELAIAPGVAISIRDLIPQLLKAKELGLQVAIFNSCSGLNIAESLISLGFSQVAVMREPVHNRVAQEFLVQFLRHLADCKDVHESIINACQFLRLEKNLTYPSAYLIPSLFCHPGAKLFRMTPPGWKQRLRKVLPSRVETVALTFCLGLSLVPQVQNFLLDKRVGIQAVYRDLTGQLPPATTPPVALVQIDEASIRRDKRIANPAPINRAYLADLVKRLADQKAQVIGIDYLLDRPVGNEKKLQQTMQAAVEQNQSWFVLATLFDRSETVDLFAPEEGGASKREWSLQGHISILPTNVTLPYSDEDCRKTCPLGYLLSLIRIAKDEASKQIPQPKLNRQNNLQTQLINEINHAAAQNQRLSLLLQSRLTPLATWCYRTLDILCLEPIIDFSIPPTQVYDRIAAWRLLEDQLDLSHLPTQVVLIGAGEYTDLDSAIDELDIYPLPTAVSYWRYRLSDQNNAAAFSNGHSRNIPAYLPVLSGVEVHAYMIHHLLNQRLIVPIPDVLAVLFAVLVGKGILWHWQQQQQKPWTRQRKILYTTGLASGISLYGFISLQAYISLAILVPWLLPTTLIWIYVLPLLRKKTYV